VREKSTFVSKIGRKIFPPKIALLGFMTIYKDSFYEEILECYNYETRNPSVYGNVIRRKVESSKSSKKLQSD